MRSSYRIISLFYKKQESTRVPSVTCKFVLFQIVVTNHCMQVQAKDKINRGVCGLIFKLKQHNIFTFKMTFHIPSLRSYPIPVLKAAF
jgi:hypothetical protein